MPRRGRLPAKYMEVFRLLAPCQGYERGMTIDEIARAMYGRTDFQAKAKARQLIGYGRRAMRRQGIDVDIFSVKPMGMPERKYCHLTTVVEYTKTIDDFEAHITGAEETQEALERRRKTVEERARLAKARRARARKARQ